MTWVDANLVVAKNGMTSLNGSSRPLSTPEDRLRFHALRKSAAAIAIGGSTYRGEPYSKSPIPVYVSTRRTDLVASGVRFLNISPLELIRQALLEVDGTIIIEGGVNFLTELIENQVIDRFHISRTEISGDAYPLDEEKLRRFYRLDSTERISETKFELWLPNRN